MEGEVGSSARTRSTPFLHPHRTPRKALPSFVHAPQALTDKRSPCGGGLHPAGSRSPASKPCPPGLQERSARVFGEAGLVVRADWRPRALCTRSPSSLYPHGSGWIVCWWPDSLVSSWKIQGPADAAAAGTGPTPGACALFRQPMCSQLLRVAFDPAPLRRARGVALRASGPPPGQLTLVTLSPSLCLG